MEIPLRAKYKSAHRGRYKGGERYANKKHRKKVGAAAHAKQYGEPPTYAMFVNGLTGKSVIRRI